MGATLLELVNALKRHESHQLLKTWYVGSFQDLGNWLRITATEDSDEECRKRAHALIASKIFPYDGKLLL